MGTMATNGGSWNERKRLIRFRRQREHLRFSEEIKLVPQGLVWVMVLLLVVLGGGALLACAKDFPEPWPIVLDLGMKGALAAVAAIAVGAWLVLTPIVLLTGYVYKDARRRGMNAGLWIFLVLILLPAYLAFGFVLYFIAREPLPYHCPKCGSLVNARFNFCPACKYELHRTCGSCQREVGDMDRYCPHCGNDLVPQAALERV
jgi:RNA polymerase subunit RPABC4/transcription elongation factor Spt4